MFKYERHDAKKTLLYNIVEKYYPQFVSCLAEDGRELPSYVRTEFEDYLVFYAYVAGIVITSAWSHLAVSIVGFVQVVVQSG